MFMQQSWRAGFGTQGAMTRVVRNADGTFSVQILRLNAASGEPAIPSPTTATDEWLSSALNDAPTLGVHLTARLDEIRAQGQRLDAGAGTNARDTYPHRAVPSQARFLAMVHKYARLHEEAARAAAQAGMVAAQEGTNAGEARQGASAGAYRSEIRQASLWRLVSALWGSPSDPETSGGGTAYLDTEDMEHIGRVLALDAFGSVGGTRSDVAGADPRMRSLVMQRRMSVAAWLRETMGREFSDTDGAPQHPRSVWEAMSRLDVAAAARMAIQSKDLRLATLVSQPSGTQAVRAQIQSQLQLWDHEWQVSDCVHQDRLRAYLLTAGVIDDTRLPVRDLSWLQGLALHLSYNGLRDARGAWACATNGSVVRAMESYTRAVSSGAARPPTVWYTAEGADGEADLDVRFLLLRLACFHEEPPIRCLSTRVGSADPLDHSVPWHLCQALDAIGLWSHHRGQGSSRQLLLAHADQHWITAQYAAQLESAGLWHWACYVALHLPDIDRAEHAVRSILKRNCPSTAVDTAAARDERAQWEARCKFLTFVVGIPASAVHLAECQRARYDRVHLPPNRWEFYQAANAKLWDTLHRNVLLHLLPQCMLQGESHVLASVLRELRGETSAGRIAGWRSSGQIVEMFLELRSALAHIEATVVAQQGGAGGVAGVGADEDVVQELLLGLRARLDEITDKLVSVGGRIALPPDNAEAHDMSGLRERSRRVLAVCEQQIASTVADLRMMSAASGGAGARVLRETSADSGALALPLEGGTLIQVLRKLTASWLEWTL